MKAQQNDDVFITFLLLIFKWPILFLIPVISFWVFKKQPADFKHVQKFFTNFQYGGHGGSPTIQPENTIASMEQAKREGADLIEFDVSLTKDGVAVILHDDTLDRTTNMSGFIRNFNFSDLKECNCAAKFLFPNQGNNTLPVFLPLPSLDELVSWAKANQIKMLFDVKDFNFSLIAKLEELFSTYQLYDVGIVSSFFPTIVYRIKHRDPRILTGLTWRRWFLSYSDMRFQIRRNTSLIKHILALIFDVIYVWSVKTWLPSFLGVDMMLTDHNEISVNYVRYQEDCGRKVVAWTVNDENEMIWMSKTLGIPFLTDKPFLAKSLKKLN